MLVCSTKQVAGLMLEQGFPKRRPFLKIENIPDQLSDDREGLIMENVDFKYYRPIIESIYRMF